MNLAIIRQRYNPFGGAERFIERAVESLRERGTQVTVITRSWQGASTKGDVEVCNPFYLGKIWRDWSFARCARKAIRSPKYDLVQSHERIAGCDIYRAGDGVHAEWLFQRGRMQSWWQRILTRFSPYHLFVLAAEKRMFDSPRLRAVICNSEMVKDEILEHYHLPATILHVVYNGIDTNLFHPRLRQEGGDIKREQLGIPPGAVIALFVGSGFKRKGLGTAMEALAKSHSGTYLVVVGTDRHAGRYVKLAHTLGITHRVRLLGGRENILQYYGCADYLILPTLYDPFPNAALEAMACGLPVITTAKCGAAVLVASEKCGVILEALDVLGFARSIDSLSQSQTRAQMSANARRAAEALTLDAMAKRLLDLYVALGASQLPTKVKDSAA
ncbi:MAG: glycosyltransferase family 4 protein [Burkholderiales bacterium]